MKLFKNNGDEKDFQRLLETFILSNKSKSYCRKVVSTICSVLAERDPKFVKPLFINQLISRTYRAKKMWKEEGHEVYDAEGNRVPIDWKVVAFSKMDQLEETSQAGMLDKARVIARTAHDIITNGTYTGSSFDDYVCLVEMCRYSGARPKEIISLSTQQWEELFEKSHTTIDSKTGRVALCVDSSVLKRIHNFTRGMWPFSFVRHTPSENKQKRVNAAYARSMAQFKRDYKKLFRGAPAPYGVGFKLFRQLLAFEAIEDGAIEQAKHLLRHKNSGMSKHYASKFGLDSALKYAKQVASRNG